MMRGGSPRKRCRRCPKLDPAYPTRQVAGTLSVCFERWGILTRVFRHPALDRPSADLQAMAAGSENAPSRGGVKEGRAQQVDSGQRSTAHNAQTQVGRDEGISKSRLH